MVFIVGLVFRIVGRARRAALGYSKADSSSNEQYSCRNRSKDRRCRRCQHGGCRNRRDRQIVVFTPAGGQVSVGNDRPTLPTSPDVVMGYPIDDTMQTMRV